MAPSRTLLGSSRRSPDPEPYSQLHSCINTALPTGGVHSIDRWKQDACWKKLGELNWRDSFTSHDKSTKHKSFALHINDYYLPRDVFREPKMCKNAFAPGLYLGPRWRSLQRSQDSLAGFWERKRVGKGRKEKEGEESGGKGGEVCKTWGKVASWR